MILSGAARGGPQRPWARTGCPAGALGPSGPSLPPAAEHAPAGPSRLCLGPVLRTRSVPRTLCALSCPGASASSDEQVSPAGPRHTDVCGLRTRRGREGNEEVPTHQLQGNQAESGPWEDAGTPLPTTWLLSPCPHLPIIRDCHPVFRVKRLQLGDHDGRMCAMLCPREADV